MSVVSVFPVSNAGPTLKIRGGADAFVGQFPYQVGISYNDVFVCGGTILRSLIILTAAHCVYQRNVRKFKVTAGDHSRSALEGTEQTRFVSHVITHDSYNPKPPYENDIAIMLLDSSLDFSSYVSMVACRESSENYKGKTFS
jgi:secreted trypsin-like serine protease